MVLGSRVKLAVLPSDDVTFIFLEAGGEEECEGVTVVLVVVVGWEEVGGWVGDFCGTCSKSWKHSELIYVCVSVCTCCVHSMRIVHMYIHVLYTSVYAFAVSISIEIM